MQGKSGSSPTGDAPAGFGCWSTVARIRDRPALPAIGRGGRSVSRKRGLDQNEAGCGRDQAVTRNPGQGWWGWAGRRRGVLTVTGASLPTGCPGGGPRLVRYTCVMQLPGMIGIHPLTGIPTFSSCGRQSTKYRHRDESQIPNRHPSTTRRHRASTSAGASAGRPAPPPPVRQVELLAPPLRPEFLRPLAGWSVALRLKIPSMKARRSMAGIPTRRGIEVQVRETDLGQCQAGTAIHC